MANRPGLNPVIADDAILLEVIQFSEFQDTCGGVSLLTGDVSLAVKAERYKLDCLEVPSHWLLPRESDPRDRELRELREQVAALQERDPRIELSLVPEVDGTVCSDFAFEIFSPLSIGQIQLLVNQAETLYPIHTKFGISRAQELGLPITFAERLLAPSAEQISKYQQEDYPNWIESVCDALKALHVQLTNQACRFDLLFQAANAGAAPAQYAEVSVRVTPGLTLVLEPDDEDRVDDEMPEPPPPPRAHASNTVSVFGLQRLATPAFDFDFLEGVPHDRTAFYWRSGRAAVSDEWISDCEEFRHRSKAETFVLNLLVNQSTRPSGGVVEFSLSATNLPEPALLRIPLRFSYMAGDTFTAAQEWLTRTKRLESSHA